jgi:hypothetical protein
VRDIRVCARLLGLRRAVIEDMRMGIVRSKTSNVSRLVSLKAVLRQCILQQLVEGPTRSVAKPSKRCATVSSVQQWLPKF